MFAQFKITNFTQTPVSQFQTKFNNNSYCLKPTQINIDGIGVLQPGETKVGEVQLDMGGNPSGENPTSPIRIQAALSSSMGIFVFEIPVYFNVLLRYPSEYSQQKFDALLK